MEDHDHNSKKEVAKPHDKVSEKLFPEKHIEPADIGADPNAAAIFMPKSKVTRLDSDDRSAGSAATGALREGHDNSSHRAGNAQPRESASLSAAERTLVVAQADSPAVTGKPEVVKTADGRMQEVVTNPDGSKKIYGLNAQGSRDGSEMSLNEKQQVTAMKLPDGSKLAFHYDSNGRADNYTYTSASGTSFAYQREGNTNYWRTSADPNKLIYMELNVNADGVHMKNNAFPDGQVLRLNGTRVADNQSNYSGAAVQPDIVAGRQPVPGEQQQTGRTEQQDARLQQARQQETSGFNNLQQGNWQQAYNELSQSSKLYNAYWQTHPPTSEAEVRARQETQKKLVEGMRTAMQGMQQQSLP